MSIQEALVIGGCFGFILCVLFVALIDWMFRRG